MSSVTGTLLDDRNDLASDYAQAPEALPFYAYYIADGITLNVPGAIVSLRGVFVVRKRTWTPILTSAWRAVRKTSWPSVRHGGPE